MFKKLIVNGSLIAVVAVFASASAAPKTVTLDVPGMNCVTCLITINRALKKVDGVQDAKSDYAKKEAVVTFDDHKTSFEKLTRATTEAGYPSTLKVSK